MNHGQPADPTPPVPDHILLFDGACSLCAGTVRFVTPRDPAGRVRFAPLQSDAARRILAAAGAPPNLPDSVVLVERGRVYTRSDAVLRLARLLRFPWPLLWGLVVVPRPVRDWVYDFVARRRHRWLGKRGACVEPTAELRQRFLE